MQIEKFAVAAAAGALVLCATPGTATAHDGQSDPPAFGIVSITDDQTIRLNVVCWAHEVDDVPPGPCRGDLMFHDAAGNVVARQSVRLAPGQADRLDFTLGTRAGPGNLVGIDPCWIPNLNSGRALPTVEVFDTQTGRTALHVNPVTPRISLIRGDERGKR